MGGRKPVPVFVLLIEGFREMNGHRGFRLVLAAGFLFGGMVPALADNHPRIPEPTEPPLVSEEFAAVKEKLEICFDCHDASGYSPSSVFPILSGQQYYYLYVQLKDFKAGLRASEIMGPIASKLEKDQMKLLARYFSEQPWPKISFKGDPARTAKGESVGVAGQCVQCHLGGYEGNSRVPRLAGQFPEYLAKTMIDFKTRARANSPAKMSLMESFTEDDIAAAAEFLADL